MIKSGQYIKIYHPDFLISYNHKAKSLNTSSLSCTPMLFPSKHLFHYNQGRNAHNLIF